MRYNRLGKTGLFVSELCFGTMTFGADGPWKSIGTVVQDEADQLVRLAFDSGINIFDTADTYSGGESERILGQAIRNSGLPRGEILLATKVFGPMGHSPNSAGSSRMHIMDGVKASLRRLQVDHIDLYQLHGFDPATPMEETLRALDDLVRQGLVRYVGASNWAAWQVMKALGISERLGLTGLASLQAYYSVVGRELEREIVPLLEQESLGMLVWSPLAGGFLSGKYRRGVQVPQGNRRVDSELAFPPVNEERGYDAVETLRTIAESRGVSVAQVSLAWLLHQKAVTSVILGTRRPEQLKDNLGAVDLDLTDDELGAIDSVSRIPQEYPGWMLQAWSSGRAAQLTSGRNPATRIAGSVSRR